MQQSPLVILCYLYYVIAWIEYIPAIVRMIRRKSSIDYSIPATVLNIVANIMWFIYVITCCPEFEMVFCSILDNIIDTTYAIVIFKYHRAKHQK